MLSDNRATSCTVKVVFHRKVCIVYGAPTTVLANPGDVVGETQVLPHLVGVLEHILALKWSTCKDGIRV